MGSGLSSPVCSVVVERRGGQSFRVGLAEMNGWRSSMEDAHVIHMQDRWGFFGVYDGHGGAQCSAFIAGRLKEELSKNGLPKDRATVKELCLRLDREFLDSGEGSGSTGAFAMVQLPETPGSRLLLRIGNVGDSRVLLAHADGSIHPGPGTDSGLTTDHKPDHPDEEARIIRTGGYVSQVMGVARVNGDLAVSRAFGDARYKDSVGGGPGPEDQPVCADPELLELECDPTDFLVVVCDGISEGNFPNAEVVQLAAAELKEHGDPGTAAAAICRQALKANSKDNLTCMIVLFNGGTLEPDIQLLPGPYSRDTVFVKAYDAMASRAGVSLAKAVEMRYDIVRQEIDEALNEGQLSELRAELCLYDDGPPESMAADSDERREWFESWLQSQSSGREDDTSMEMKLLRAFQESRAAEAPDDAEMPEAVDGEPESK